MSPKSTANLASVPAPSSDVTPEGALKMVTKAILEAGIFAKGQRINQCKIVGQKLTNALEDVATLRAKLAEMEAGMAPLVKEALDAVAGKPLTKPTATETPAGTPDAPVTPATK